MLIKLLKKIVDCIFNFGPCGTGAKKCTECPHFYEDCFPSKDDEPKCAS